MVKPAHASLAGMCSVKSFGGHIAQLADLNNDGKLELLMLQSAGQLRSDIVGAGRTDIDERDRNLFCLTAVSLAGEMLWQEGTPWQYPEEPFTSHGGAKMICVDDIDRDGKAEVIAIHIDELMIFDGATGKLRDSRRLPADNFSIIYAAQFGEPERGKQIICKVNDRGYPPWEYSNPTVIYNADLTVHREPFAIRGSGHNLVLRDIDGDGRDEMFIGYSLLDHDGSEIWSIDLGEDFNYAVEHADQIEVGDMDGDGLLEVRYAGSEDFFVADLHGNIKWQSHAGHSQTSISGPWGPNGETRIIMSEKNRGIWGLDTDGQILWNRTDINGYARPGIRWHHSGPRREWAMFRPQLKPFKETPADSDPALSPQLWPKFIDGDGTLIEVFPWDDSYAQPKRSIRASRSYDNGVWYDFITRDIDGDGLDEVIIFDRYNVWIFRSTFDT